MPRIDADHWGLIPAPGFDQPFEVLGACHERVQRMLSLLRRLRAHMQARGADEQARQAACELVRYFHIAAPVHHEDEERHVFPPLLARGECVDTVNRLRDEHREMAAIWPSAHAILDAVAEGRRASLSLDDLEHLDHYETLYGWHLAAENELVFPVARRHLGLAMQAAMGAEMARRRGLPDTPQRLRRGD